MGGLGGVGRRGRGAPVESAVGREKSVPEKQGLFLPPTERDYHGDVTEFF